LKNLGEEAGKYLGTGIAGGLKNASREATKAFNGFYERLKYQRDFDLISEEEYYKRLEELRDRYFQKGTDNWMKYTKMLYNYQEKLIKQQKSEIESLYDDITDYATEKLEQILKKQQKLAENLNNFGSFYNVNTVHMNGFTDHYYSLHDLSLDIEAIERYSRDIKNVKERAQRLSASDDATNYLLDSIKQMDTEDALQFMGALLYANDDMFSKYIEKAYEKFSLSESVSKDAFSREFSQGIEDAYANMKDVLTKAGYEIPDGFFVSGSISAQKFGEAFVLELDNQLKFVREMIDDFNAGLEFELKTGGDTYNTTNTSYNISSQGAFDTVEQIKRHETVKRLAGIS